MGKVIRDGIHKGGLEMVNDYELKLFGKSGEQGEVGVEGRLKKQLTS